MFLISGLGFCQWPLKFAARLVPGPMRPESIGPSGYVVRSPEERCWGADIGCVMESSSDDVITDEIRVNIKYCKA